jgi:hypothetical protein
MLPQSNLRVDFYGVTDFVVFHSLRNFDSISDRSHGSQGCPAVFGCKIPVAEANLSVEA